MVLAVAVVLAALGVRRETNVAAMERRLRAALGPDGDSLYRVRVGSSHLSIFAGSYLATGIEIIPDTLAFRQRREAGRPVRDRFLLTVASFKVTGLGMWGLLRHRFEAGTAVAESARVEVSLDRTVPDRADTLRRLPHEFFRSITRPVRLDTFRLENGDFLYSETAVDGARPGALRFAKTRVGVYNLSNDTLRPSTPVVIDVHTLLAGSAPTAVVFEYDFRAQKLNLDYRGTVSDLDARRLNEITENLEGLHLADGRLDSAWFNFRVKDGVANGEMRMLYRHLSARFVDKVTLKGGVSEVLKSFVANTFALHGHNRRDGDHRFRVGSVRGFVRTPNLPIFKYVWHTLRAGLFLTMTGKE
jgi:hypothetical protein